MTRMQRIQVFTLDGNREEENKKRNKMHDAVFSVHSMFSVVTHYAFTFGFKHQDWPSENSSPSKLAPDRKHGLSLRALLLCRSIALPWSN